MMKQVMILTLLLVCLASVERADAQAPVDESTATPTSITIALPEIDRINLESNLRWVIARERARTLRQLQENGKPIEHERVGVLADAGVWHVGAKSIVELLEEQKLSCRVLDRTLVTVEELARFEVVILPGGWAPHQWAALGDKGLMAIQHFVEKGGRCVAICAGAYLLAKTTKYEGIEYPYPLGLFDGVAIGPVAELAPFPKPGSTRLKITEAGIVRGIEKLNTEDVYYSGGPAFEGGTNVVVLARYPDNSPAMISRPVGKGEVVLIGAHLERPVLSDKGDQARPPKFAGPLFKALCFPM